MTDIKDMKTSDMVAEYNKLTGKTIKKFSTRADGEKRLAAAREAAKPAKPAKPAQKVSKYEKPIPAKSTGFKREVTKRTMRSAIVEAIMDGKTNNEIWDMIVDEFDADPVKHKHYPAWYRGDLRRKGLIAE